MIKFVPEELKLEYTGQDANISLFLFDDEAMSLYADLVGYIEYKQKRREEALKAARCAGDDYTGHEDDEAMRLAVEQLKSMIVSDY